MLATLFLVVETTLFGKCFSIQKITSLLTIVIKNKCMNVKFCVKTDFIVVFLLFFEDVVWQSLILELPEFLKDELVMIPVIVDKLSKIESFDVSGVVLKWFESYFTRLDRNVSNLEDVFLALLRPSTFRYLYRPDCLLCRNLGFADYFKIYCMDRIHCSLARLSSWCIRNEMDLNIDKCYVITFT